MGQAWKDWASVFFLLTYGDNEIKDPALLEEIKYLLGRLGGYVDTIFQQDLDHIGIDGSGLETGTLDLEIFSAHLLQVGLGHLAAGAVVGADDEHFVHC
jgi:hypothetical protein